MLKNYQRSRIRHQFPIVYDIEIALYVSAPRSSPIHESSHFL